LAQHYHIRLFETKVQGDRNSPKFALAGAIRFALQYGVRFYARAGFTRGGKDVTQAVSNSLRGQAAQPPAAGPIRPKN
jgi:hypothetical protein